MKKIVTLSGVMFLMSCNASHLVYVQETSLGLTLSAGTEGVQKFSLGYDRDIFAIVPKKTGSDDSMSLLSVNKASIGGINDIKVSEFVATGEPATKLSAKPEAITALRNKVYGAEE